MEGKKKAYMVILLNPRTGEVAGAYRTDLEKVDEDLKSITLEKLKKEQAKKVKGKKVEKDW